MGNKQKQRTKALIPISKIAMYFKLQVAYRSNMLWAKAIPLYPKYEYEFITCNERYVMLKEMIDVYNMINDSTKDIIFYIYDNNVIDWCSRGCEVIILNEFRFLNKITK